MTESLKYMHAYTDTHMGTKTISIMDDVYELLTSNRKDKESFSDVIRRSLDKKKELMHYAGSWKDMSDTEHKMLGETVSRLRRSKRNYL